MPTRGRSSNKGDLDRQAGKFPTVFGVALHYDAQMITADRLCPSVHACVILCACFCQPAAAADTLFDLVHIETSGRVVTAHLADFDGDGRTDLMLVALDGVPPLESRTISVHLQQADGEFANPASHSLPVPRWSAVYDVADLKDSPGEELVLLRPDGVSILSLADASRTQWDLPVPAPSTVAASSDERGFDRLQMVYHDFGTEPWIMVPQIGAVTALTADGSVQARIDAGRRANYYVAKPAAIISVESDIQLFLDAPKLGVGDVDGNGLSDIVATTRHEIRVFLRDPDSGFSQQPSQAIPLTFVSKLDHSRGSGSLVPQVRDIDGDDLLDLMITHIEGSFTDSITTTYIYRNRDGRWNMDEPDDRFISKGVWISDLLMPLDADERLELVRIQFRFSVFEMVELLLTRKIDAQIAIHRLQPDGHYQAKPWSRKKVSVGVSFDTFRPKGFMPTGGLDLNADGLMDFVTSANGKGIQVYLGGGDGPFARRPSTQKFTSTGVIRFADINDDRLTDFVLYNPQAFDAEVSIGRNLGALPGSPTPVADP